MRQQIKPTVERLVIRPVRDLVDTTFRVITSPATVAREFASQDGHQFARAVTYFVAAFSAAVILEKIASWSLGIETLSDLSYWTMNLLLILSNTVLAVLIAFVLGSTPSALFVKSACLAFGACALIGSFLVAGASLTLAALHQVGYIPDFIPDFTSLENYKHIYRQAYFDCLREESTLFAFVFDGFGARYEELNDPLDEISWVSGVFFIVACVVFAVLAFFGTERRRWAAAVAASLSACIVIGGTVLGAKVWTKHLRATSPCTTKSLRATAQATAEDYARTVVKTFDKHIGKPTTELGAILTGVERRGTSVILRLQIPWHANGVEGFADWVMTRRQELLRKYCDWDGSAKYSRIIGLTQVYVYRYADTDRVETVVQSPEGCTQ